MSTITAIITAYRRPQNIAPLVAAILAQSVPAAAIWAWANDPSDKMKVLLAGAKLDRVVTSSENAFFHGRFALALLAPTEFVALFDDDSIPGKNWFANCLDTFARSPGILGTAGVELHEAGYAKRTMHGWQRPGEETVEVDLAVQAWFLRTEWVKHLFSGPPVVGTNGEDIELAARAWRLAGIRSFCPAHPAKDQSRWGSTRGLELGIDEVAASLRVEHLSERRRIVEAEIAAGWKPLFMRKGTGDRAQGTGEIANCELQIANLKLEEGGNSAAPRCSGQCAANSIGDALERERDPLAFLRALRPSLEGNQRLTGSVANVRRESVIRGLLEGRWQNGDPGRLRYFTRRELEKLFYRAGFHVAIKPKQEDGLPSPSSNGDGLGIPARRDSSGRGADAVAGLVRVPASDANAPNSHESGYARDSLGIPARRDSRNAAPLFASGFSADEAADMRTDRFDFEALRDDPRDYGLTSIVVVTHNQVSCTRACLESIRFVTDEPYELIVVDNGSTDGTVDCLRSCPDVTLIENADNRGFPAAANQGILASTGKQVLLLNNDVIVTTGWLRRMLEALEGSGSGVQGTGEIANCKLQIANWQFEATHEVNGDAAKTQDLRPKTSGLNPKSKIQNPKSLGLVGPLTNSASGYQEIPVTYSNLACLDGFAWEHAKAHAGQVQEVDRLIGFCLLIRREVIDEVGLFDERFGIGNYEDDDYCRRARQAGWRLAVAREAFIHHFGHRTFDAAGVDLNAVLEHNKRLYDEKWRAEDGLPSPSQEQRDGLGRPSSLPHPSSLIPLSLCMIVRDNERTIRAALESIRPWVDEMIVVDTGSTDATPDICRELGAQVYHFPWPDSFAIARNESLKYARGEWIFWMDSDDVIDAENGRKLRALVAGLVRRGEIANCELRIANCQLQAQGDTTKTQDQSPKTPDLNPKSKIENPKSPGVLGYVMQVHCPGKDDLHDVTVVDQLKLFRNRPDLRFEGRIHEQVLGAINRAQGEMVFADIFVVHAGADRSPDGRIRKLKRDIKLLRLDRRERPNHTFVHFNLGMTYSDAGKHLKAIKALRRSLALAQPHESHVRKVYALLVVSHCGLGQRAEARQACAEGLRLFPKDPELLFRNGMLSHEDGQLRTAEASYLAALANDDSLHFGSIDRGIVGFKARQNLAAVYTDMGALGKAEEQWRRIVEEVPTYRDGWRWLVENLLLQGKLRDAEQSVERVFASDPRLRATGLTLAARIAEATGQVEAALATLRQARRECPDDAAPLDDLCRHLFYRGEPRELEEALREMVRRQPENAAAHQNLGTTLLRAGRFQEAAEAFRMSLRERPDSAVTQLSLGYALSSAGNPREAGAAFEQCIRLAPEPRLVAEAQRQLAALAA